MDFPPLPFFFKLPSLLLPGQLSTALLHLDPLQILGVATKVSTVIHFRHQVGDKKKVCDLKTCNVCIYVFSNILGGHILTGVITCPKTLKRQNNNQMHTKLDMHRCELASVKDVHRKEIDHLQIRSKILLAS